MARASDGTDVPISPLLASSSNMGSPDGSLPELDGTGYRATTMEEQSTTFIHLQLPLFLQNTSRNAATDPQPLGLSGPMAQGHLMTLEIQDEDLIHSQAPKMNQHEVPSYSGSLANLSQRDYKVDL